MLLEGCESKSPGQYLSLQSFQSIKRNEKVPNLTRSFGPESARTLEKTLVTREKLRGNLPESFVKKREGVTKVREV